MGSSVGRQEWGPGGFTELVDFGKSLGYRFLRFCDVEAATEGRQILMRHDVDFSLALAHRLATHESELGVSATYFVQVRSDVYSVTSTPGSAILREIVDMGHEIGLHFDSAHYGNVPDPSRQGLIFERGILQGVVGEEVSAYSLHNPSLNGMLDLQARDLTDAYSAALSGRFEYLSDSCRSWRREPYEFLRNGVAVQMLLHPLYWTVDGDVKACFSTAEECEVSRLRGAFADGYQQNRLSLRQRSPR